MNTTPLSVKSVAHKLTKVMEENKLAAHIDHASFKLTRSTEHDWLNVFVAQVRLNLKGSNIGHNLNFRIVASTDNKLMCELINNSKPKLLPLNTGVEILVNTLREGDKIVAQGLTKQFREFECINMDRVIDRQLVHQRTRAIAVARVRHRRGHRATQAA